MNSETVPAPWYANLLLVVGVVLTVVMALLMSQLDRLQTRLVPTVQVVAQVTEPVMTPTPLSAIALATAVQASPTPIASDDDSTMPGSTAVPTVACGQPPAGWVSYVVQSGDTLFALSRDTGATVDQIVQVNCLEVKQFVTGMQIYLPTSPSQRIVCGPPNWWVRYTVQAGDTMFSLARSRGTTVSQIMSANCMVSTRLYTGRQIYLPPGGATAVPTATPVPPTAQPTSKPQPTNTAPPPPSPTLTPPPVATMTPTNTPVPPTPTNTLVPATPTNTPIPPTPISTPTNTPTNTPIPPAPTNTPTNTPIPLTPTNTPTNTPVPPTPTNTPTDTPIPPTPTDTPVPQTPMETSASPEDHFSTDDTIFVLAAYQVVFGEAV